MPEYIQFSSENGRITNKWFSVDPSVIEGLSNIIEIPRDVYYALNDFYVVDNGILRKMTEDERNIFLAEKEKIEKELEDNRLTILDKLIEDADLEKIILSKIDTLIDNIGNLEDVKIFLKRFCRFTILHLAISP